MSNVGQSGYESFVKSLKTNITNGDIIQAVPSQRIAIPMQNANDENEAFNSIDVFVRGVRAYQSIYGVA